MPRELYIHRAVSDILDAIPAEAWIPERKVPVAASPHQESQLAPVDALAKIAYPVVEEMLNCDSQGTWTVEKIARTGGIGTDRAIDGEEGNILKAAIFIVSDLKELGLLVFKNGAGTAIDLGTEFCIRDDNLSLAQVYDYCAHLAQLAGASPVEIERCRDYATYLRGR